MSLHRRCIEVGGSLLEVIVLKGRKHIEEKRAVHRVECC